MKDHEARIHELVNTAGIDPNAAIELMKYAIDYLTNRDNMPIVLADYLANAFRRTVSVRVPIHGTSIAAMRIQALAKGLGLSGKEGQPRKNIPPELRGQAIATVFICGNKEKEYRLRSVFAEKLGISKNTAARLIKEIRENLDAEMKPHHEMLQKLMEFNRIKSLVLPRKIKEDE